MPAILTNRELDVNTFRELVSSQDVDNCGMDFHANLRAIRELRGLSQTALAEACGWDRPTRITNYESRSDNPRNRRQPSFNDLLILADALKVPTALLFSETPPKQLDQKSDLRSPSARLDAVILRNANMVLTALLGRAPLMDLDRDAELISLAYAWAADRTDSALYERLSAAVDQRKEQGESNVRTGGNEGDAGRLGRRASPRRK